MAARPRLPREPGHRGARPPRTRSSRACEGWRERRGALDFEIDGVVVKVDDLELQRRLGAVGPRPALGGRVEVPAHDGRDHACARSSGTSASSATCTRSPRSSRSTIGGVTVKLATLHNEEDLARKDIRTGDEVIVLRAGDVIPQVVSPAPHAVENPDRDPPERPPARCPVCDTPTIKRGRLHPLPQPRLPRPPLAAAQGLRGRDGHGGPGREAGRGAPGGRAAAHRRRLLRAHPRAAARGAGHRPGHGRATSSPRSTRRASGRSARCSTRSGSRASATSPAAASPSSSARPTRCSPRRPRRSPRRRGSARSSPG